MNNLHAKNVPVSLQLETDIMSYGPEPSKGEEVSQKSIEPNDATTLVEELSSIFIHNPEVIVQATDVGVWEAKIKYVDGSINIYHGSVGLLDRKGLLRQWEIFARRMLRFKPLFLFGGANYHYRTIVDDYQI